VRGYQSGGIAATAKHFPGLGSTTISADNGIAVSDETRAQFDANDPLPFRAAISAGVDEIMAAHIVAPSLDPSGAPASLSKPIVTDLLCAARCITTASS
jgi:beta-N-acetylhexosaminidase